MTTAPPFTLTYTPRTFFARMRWILDWRSRREVRRYLDLVAQRIERDFPTSERARMALELVTTGRAHVRALPFQPTPRETSEG